MQDYCADQVRQMDYPHYVMTLFAPVKKRQALWALYAFNIEMAKIRSLVTEPMMGMIRLQWWRDAIEKLYTGEVLRHEVLTGLKGNAENWQPDNFITLIDAYEIDLEIDHFETEQQLVDHALVMGYPLLGMSCDVYGQYISPEIIKILGACEYIVNRIEHDRRCLKLNKKAIMNDIKAKINLIDCNILKKSPAFLSYSYIRWKLNAIGKEKPSNDLMLGFYLWRKSFGF